MNDELKNQIERLVEDKLSSAQQQVYQNAIIPGQVKPRHLVPGNGDIGNLYYSDENGGFSVLSIGADDQILTAQSGLPTFADPSVPSPWTEDTNTWIYASATTFTITGDFTTVFTKGTRLRFTQTTAKYGVVKSSAFSTGTTTITLISNTDYSIANAAIASPSYSYADMPPGYPGSFAYTTTWTGFSANPSGGITRFTVVANRCIVDINQPSNGTSNATTLTFSLPVASSFDLFALLGRGVDNNTALTAPSRVDISGSTGTAYKDLAQTAWTNSSGKNIISQFSFEF